jgi:signal transduction histidine kinase
VTVNANSNDLSRHEPRTQRPDAPASEPDAGRGRRRDRARADRRDGWERVQAVIDAVPEAVFVATGSRVDLTNAAADRLFPDEPVEDPADLVARFEPVIVDRAEALPRPGRDDPSDEGVIVRQRNRPNRWFALRTVALDARREPGTGATDPPGATEPDAATEPDPAEQPVAFVLRDVTDTPDLRPLREAFLGLVSHELRTPITTIYAGSTVLARSPQLSVPATRTLAHDVSAEAARLYDVVEDLLALGRIERGVLDPLDEPVDLGQVIDGTLRVAAGRHPTLRIRRGGRVGAIIGRGDATYLDQALRNIVLAIARRPGGAADAAIDIDVAIDRDRDELIVTVTDDGPAMTPAELGTLFALAEVGAPPNPLGGLALYVARQLILAMGGRVWARTPDEGRGLEVGTALRLAA